MRDVATVGLIAVWLSHYKNLNRRHRVSIRFLFRYSSLIIFRISLIATQGIRALAQGFWLSNKITDFQTFNLFLDPFLIQHRIFLCILSSSYKGIPLTDHRCPIQVRESCGWIIFPSSTYTFLYFCLFSARLEIFLIFLFCRIGLCEATHVLSCFFFHRSLIWFRHSPV